MTMGVSSVTGLYASERESILEAVASRCTTIRGERWFRPEYGTQLYAVVGENAREAVLPRYRGVILGALALDDHRYLPESVELEIEDTDIVANVAVRSVVSNLVVSVSLRLPGVV